MQVTKRSILTGKEHTLELPITDQQMSAWYAGAMVQDAFPNLSADQREFLLSGSTPDEWNAAFGSEE